LVHAVKPVQPKEIFLRRQFREGVNSVRRGGEVREDVSTLIEPFHHQGLRSFEVPRTFDVSRLFKLLDLRQEEENLNVPIRALRSRAYEFDAR
jgi:hypothetical protein